MTHSQKRLRKIESFGGSFEGLRVSRVESFGEGERAESFGEGERIESFGGGRCASCLVRKLTSTLFQVSLSLPIGIIWYYLRGLGTLCVLSNRVYKRICVT
jgi:hypothetical protein